MTKVTDTDSAVLPERDRHTLVACFLGPYGENDGLPEKLMVEFLRDHVYWRRNFHPEDSPAISTAAARHPDYLAFEARLRRELHQLSAALKRSVPFHSLRYLGHTVSDLLLPGLAAQMLTIPYNPNNVSEEAAPVRSTSRSRSVCNWRACWVTRTILRSRSVRLAI